MLCARCRGRAGRRACFCFICLAQAVATSVDVRLLLIDGSGRCPRRLDYVQQVMPSKCRAEPPLRRLLVQEWQVHSTTVAMPCVIVSSGTLQGTEFVLHVCDACVERKCAAVTTCIVQGEARGELRPGSSMLCLPFVDVEPTDLSVCAPTRASRWCCCGFSFRSFASTRGRYQLACGRSRHPTTLWQMFRGCKSSLVASHAPGSTCMIDGTIYG